MPHHKHHKNSKNRQENGHETPENSNGNLHVEVAAPRAQEEHAVSCCVPSGCLNSGETIDPSDPGSAVRVTCNNELCTLGNWMHKECFDSWEESVLNYLRSCGRARSWSEKQRLQNLWTKKGYDLAFKACDCKCGRGHLRKDLDYIPPPKPIERRLKKKSKKNDKPMPVMSTMKGVNSHPLNNGNHFGHEHENNHETTLSRSLENDNTHARKNNNTCKSEDHLKLDNKHTQVEREKDANKANTLNGLTNGNIWQDRDLNDNNNNTANIFTVNRSISAKTILTRERSDSIESVSSGSSMANSSDSSPSASPFLNGNNNIILNPLRAQKPKFDFTGDSNLAHLTNMFKKRLDFSAFNALPRHKQNPYHIKMEDDVTGGNDETRTFVLTQLASYKVSSLSCVLCKRELPVFDHYPLVDGTFFLSPQAYSDGVVQVISEGRLQFINAVCVQCLEGSTNVHCIACKKKWDGSTLLLGSMYSYDIFAAMPCCQKRLSCKHCRRAVVDVNNGLPFYSEYSHMIACPYCKAHDYHFIRPMPETFSVHGSIWQ